MHRQPRGKEVLRGMTLDAVAALARRQYNMSYGALMGFVHETGHRRKEASRMRKMRGIA